LAYSFEQQVLAFQIREIIRATIQNRTISQQANVWNIGISHALVTGLDNTVTFLAKFLLDVRPLDASTSQDVPEWVALKTSIVDSITDVTIVGVNWNAVSIRINIV
jgi:hypothetical protein